MNRNELSTIERVRMAEKIGLAKAKLEGAREEHHLRCNVERDPEGLAPCNCGADKINSAIDRALGTLRLG